MKLELVGGTYHEVCKEGEWQQLYGSGLRAAAALKNVGEVHLNTYAGLSDKVLVETVASTFGVALNLTTTDQTIRFTYDHGLSVPLIYPPLHIVARSPALHVSADRALRFGMVEGDAIVHADMAVYDPQSAYSPQLFIGNGSVANRLVIVCNRREAFLLSGERDPVIAGAKLRALERAEAVVVKCGSYGALLATDTATQWIPAFRTTRVWPIGSGDVFAATFFAIWVGGGAIVDAALIASRATAHYCDTQSLPLPNLRSELNDYAPISLKTVKPTDPKPRVYLAGPFFNMGQRWMVHETRDALAEQGLDVFSPFHDVGFGVAAEVVPADLKGLQEADVVFALLDHLDSGTVFEVGYARSIGKPVIGFCQNTTEDSLKMLAGTDCEIFDDFVSAIYHTAWTALRA